MCLRGLGWRRRVLTDLFAGEAIATDVFAEIPVFTLIVYEWPCLGEVYFTILGCNAAIHMNGQHLTYEHIVRAELDHLFYPAFYVKGTLLDHG